MRGRTGLNDTHVVEPSRRPSVGKNDGSAAAETRRRCGHALRTSPRQNESREGRSQMRRTLIAVFLLCITAHISAQTPPHRPVAIVAEFDGIIHPVSAEFLIGVINQADSSNADVVVIVLR